MPNLEALLWSLLRGFPPVFVACVAGGWLARRGDRHATAVFLLWAAAESAHVTADYAVNWVWRPQPGVTQGDWLPVLSILWFVKRWFTACAVVSLTWLLLTRPEKSDAV